MADSFRALVAEVLGKYPQYESILNNIRTEHNQAKLTLQEAKSYTDTIGSRHQEYLSVINGILRTTESARDSALRHLQDTQNVYDQTQNVYDQTKDYKDQTQILHDSVKTAINRIDQIASDYASLNLERLIKDILQKDGNLEVAFNKITQLLVLEPKYIELRNEILSNQRIILKDIQEQGKIALDAYSDARDYIFKQKANVNALIFQAKESLKNTQSLSVSAQNEIESLKTNTLTLILSHKQEALANIKTQKDKASFEITHLKTQAISNLSAKESGINALFDKTKEIIKDAKEIQELTRNYAFSLKVRQFMAVSSLMAVATTANHTQSLITKARLEYQQTKAKESALKAKEYLEQTEKLAKESKAFINQTTQHFLAKLQDFKAQAFQEAQDFKQQALQETAELKQSFEQELEAIKQEAITQTNAIKDDMEAFVLSQKELLQEQLKIVAAGKEWVQEKANHMAILAYLNQGAKKC